MNQVTNKIPYGLLSEEDQAQLCGEAKTRGMYEYYNYNARAWSITADNKLFASNSTYRLIIKEDEWYYVESIQGRGLILTGRELEGRITGGYDTLRPATAEEIEAAKPKELTLEEKVKAEYPDYEVVMLDWNSLNRWVMPNGYLHIDAQSMKGFYRYVYQDPDGDWDTSTLTTMMWDNGITLQPIAVLFNK
jgi:hypothetical protein